MENRLFEYMNRRIAGNYKPQSTHNEPGPVITISRQTGCGARGIASAICDEFNRQIPAASTENRWKYISREILQESARELDLDTTTLKQVVDDKDRGIMDQIVGALSTHSFKSDQKILKTVHEVIRKFGQNGKTVIIGRGGASICSDIKRALHIWLVAPEEWRIGEIQRRFDYSKTAATDYVRRRDKEREMLITRLLGRKPDSLAFDIEINRSRFTEKQLAEIIIQLALTKGIL